MNMTHSCPLKVLEVLNDVFVKHLMCLYLYFFAFFMLCLIQPNENALSPLSVYGSQKNCDQAAVCYIITVKALLNGQVKGKESIHLQFY